MTSPNIPTQTDIQEIRERIKQWLPPSFTKDIDAGLLDGFGLYRRAEQQLIRERSQEEVGE